MVQTLDTQPTQSNDTPRPSRIAETFARLKAEGRTAVLPYLTVGYPDLETTLAGVPAIVRGGGDLIELGMAFSDPLADGVTVQKANQRALENGVNTGTTIAPSASSPTCATCLAVEMPNPTTSGRSVYRRMRAR